MAHSPNTLQEAKVRQKSKNFKILILYLGYGQKTISRYCPFKQHHWVHQALCYLSVCVLPDKAIPVMLDITKRISMSHSYKTKMSMLEYVQVIPLSQSALLQEVPIKDGYKLF